MSVLIKGIGMPPNCFFCKLSFMSGERLFCSAMKNEEVLRSKIDSNCPLIEVPPHGRLIDADALMKKLNNCMFPSDMVTTRAVSMAVNWLKESPTIIESEGE